MLDEEKISKFDTDVDQMHDDPTTFIHTTYTLDLTMTSPPSMRFVD